MEPLCSDEAECRFSCLCKWKRHGCPRRCTGAVDYKQWETVSMVVLGQHVPLDFIYGNVDWRKRRSLIFLKGKKNDLNQTKFVKGCNKESFKTKISSKWLKFDYQEDNGFRNKTKFKRFTNYFYYRYTLSCLDHQCFFSFSFKIKYRTWGISVIFFRAW